MDQKELGKRALILRNIMSLKLDLDELGIPWDGVRDLKRTVIAPIVDEQVTKTLTEVGG